MWPTRINRLNDRSLAKVANQIAGLLSDARINLLYGANTYENFINIVDLRSISDKTFSIRRLEIYEPSTKVYLDICRGRFVGQEGADRNKFITQRASALYDEFLLSAPAGQIQPGEVKKIDSIFASHLADDLGEVEGENDLASLVSTQLEQLRSLALDFSNRQIEAESRLEDSYRKRQDALEARISLEDDRITQNRQAALAEVEKERQKIEEWRKEINDREPQHERRRLRETLTDELKDFVALPSSMSSKREMLASAFYIIIGVLFFVYSLYTTVQTESVAKATTPISQTAFWYFAVKSVATGLGGAAFIWAGLAGLKSAVTQAREFEQKIRKYSFDMDRASWVVETILQMNSTEASQIPDEWLGSVCRDLFSITDQPREEMRSLDALAALLDTTARAKIGTSGIDFELDGKGARKLARQNN